MRTSLAAHASLILTAVAGLLLAGCDGTGATPPTATATGGGAPVWLLAEMPAGAVGVAEIKKTAVTLNTINEKSPFTGVNMPLHMGAVRYYREKGIKIPARLIPPEAK